MIKPDLDRAYIPTPEARKRTGLSRSYLGLLLRNGDLEGFRLGRDWFIYTDSLERFLKKPRKPGPKGPRKKLVLDHPDSPSSNSNKTSNANEAI